MLNIVMYRITRLQHVTRPQLGFTWVTEKHPQRRRPAGYCAFPPYVPVRTKSPAGNEWGDVGWGEAWECAEQDDRTVLRRWICSKWIYIIRWEKTYDVISNHQVSSYAKLNHLFYIYIIFIFDINRLTFYFLLVVL